MKNTNSKKKITIEINGEKITASKGFFRELSLMAFEASEYDRKRDYEQSAEDRDTLANLIYDALDKSGYFDNIRKG